MWKALLFLAVAASAAEDEAPLTIDPIRVAEHPRTERAFQQQQRAWAGRALEEPFRARAAGQRWEKAALAFVGRALDVWPGTRTTPDLPLLSQEGLAVQAAGCRDPLVVYLTACFRWLATEEHYATREECQKAMNAAEKLPGSRVLALLAARDFCHLDEVVKLGVGDTPKRLMNFTSEAWKDGGYLPGDDAIFVRQLFTDRNDAFFHQHFNALWELLKAAGLPEWAAATIEGRVEIERAWKQRGNGGAETVTDEGWRAFRQHLGRARQLLTKAWKARRDEPFAATFMIRVAMTGEVGEEEQPRLWFDRAVAAQCDFSPAYRQFVLAWTPRWGGSFELMVQLAKECADTRRFDTEVPRRAFAVLARANEETQDFWQLYARPEVAPLVVAVAKGYAEAAAPENKRRALAELAVYARVAGQYEVAGAALRACGADPLPYDTTVLLRELGTNERALRGDVALLAGPLSSAFAEAEKLRAEKKAGAARTAYEALQPKASGPAQARLRGLAGICAVEEKLAAGEWAPIPTDAALGGWIERTGRWFATPEGMPAIREGDGPVRIVYGAQVGPNFELKATLHTEGEKARWFQGIVFGDERYKMFWEKWNGAFVRFDKGREIGTARCFFKHFVTTLPAVDCPLLDTNEFTLRVQNEKLTWTVNGQKIHTNAKLQGLKEDDHVGFGSFKHTSGVTTSLLKMEVRRLPAE